jgi:predicted ATP-binding protein involved in virulence
MPIFRRWKRRGQRLVDAVTQNDREAKIYVQHLKFSGGQAISLDDSSILVIVGPNNAGKSSVLREIRDYIHEGYSFGPVLRGAEVRVKGSVSAFKKQII